MAEHGSRKRARDMMTKMGYRVGGHVGRGTEKPAEGLIRKAMGEHDTQLHGGKHTDLTFKTGGTVSGMKTGGRLDKHARGGKARGKKGHTTNVVIAMPKDKEQVPVPVPKPVPVPVGGGGGAPPPGAGAPPSGAMAGPGSMPMGQPAMGMKPPGMKRGGGVKYPIDDGAGGGLGRLEKARAYGAKKGK